MGHGAYSSLNREVRSTTLGYDTRPAHEIFSRNFNSSMNPNGVEVRESRDSEEHPNSLPIILGLDITGSMGRIPHNLVKNGLPSIMQTIIDGGVADPQVLFMGIGDHECDRAPLQIGQFESGDELLDRWLTDLWIEGGGGGNMGESYLLAWYFASRYTATDHFEQRGQKGILFTIGDEPCLSSLPVQAQESIMGTGQYQNFSARELLEAAQEQWEVFHLHMRQNSAIEHWQDLIGDNLIIVQDQNMVANIIADKVLEVSAEQGVSTADSPTNVSRFENLEE